MPTIYDKGNVSLRLSHLQVLREFRTAHHRAAIYCHPQLGRVLALDGEIQHVEAWAPLYHEPLVHLPAAFIKRPQTALILGGGSFFTAREVLRYRSIQRVLMLDHDSKLMDGVSRFYDHVAIVKSDPRLEVQTRDAFSALPMITERFDLVINDSVDLFRLKESNIFALMSRLLRPKGVCSDLVYRHIFENQNLNQTIRLLRSSFQTVMSLVFAPEYPGVLHLLTLWSKSNLLSHNIKDTVNLEQSEWTTKPRSNPCSYFDPRFLKYYLYLPKYVKDRLDEDFFTGTSS